MDKKPVGKLVSELARLVGGRVAGDGDIVINRVAGLEGAGPGAISFVESSRNIDAASKSHASCLLAPEGVALESHCLIVVADPKFSFATIAEVLHPGKRLPPGIHPAAIVASTAQIDPTAFLGACVQVGERSRIGAGSQIFAGTVIGDDVVIGEDCVLHPNVVIYDAMSLGSRVILHAGVVVGADGFGYVRGPAGYRKFPQIGTVRIEDDVEIGAGSCIDRGALGETRIGQGTKIDNLVQVAHNVSIGARVVIAAQTGISGSTVIEDDAVIGGQVGMGDHARVQRGATIGSKAGVLPGKIVRAGSVMWGVPVRPLDEYKRLNAHFGRLPQLRAEIEELKRQVAALERVIEAGTKTDV